MSRKSILHITSLQGELSKYGSRNNTPIKAIGVFEIDIDKIVEFDLIQFSFQDPNENQMTNVVIPYTELRNKIAIKNDASKTLLVLWLLPNGQIYNVTNIGIESEWWFVTGGMGKGTNMDFTKFFKT